MNLPTILCGKVSCSALSTKSLKFLEEADGTHSNSSNAKAVHFMSSNDGTFTWKPYRLELLTQRALAPDLLSKLAAMPRLLPPPKVIRNENPPCKADLLFAAAQASKKPYRPAEVTSASTRKKAGFNGTRAYNAYFKARGFEQLPAGPLRVRSLARVALPTDVSSTIDYRDEGQLQDPISEGSDGDGQPSPKAPRWVGPRPDICIPLQPLVMTSSKSTPASPWCESPPSDSESVQLEERCAIKGLATMANILMDRWERRASGAVTAAETQPPRLAVAPAHAPHTTSDTETVPATRDILQPQSPHSCASTQLEVDSE
jgi:hypothetical protein